MDKFIIIRNKNSFLSYAEPYFMVQQFFPIRSKSFYHKNKIKYILCPVKININSGIFENLGNIQIIMYNINPSMFINQNIDTDFLRKQYNSFNDQKFSMKISNQIIKKKISEKYKLLEKLSVREMDLKISYDLIGEEMREYSDPQSLMLHEAKIAKLYFRSIRIILNKYNWEFKKRSRRPARDEFNALINYGYAVIKNHISQILIAIGFDIYVGVFHTLRPGRESLVLDVLEMYRQNLVDLTVFELIIFSKIKKNDFSRSENKIDLGKNAKKFLISGIIDKLYTGPEPKIINIIEYCEKLKYKILEFSP